MSKVKQITAVILTAAFILGGIMSGLSESKSQEMKAARNSADQIVEVLYPPTEKRQ